MKAIGIDIGGTKIAAGLVDLETGRLTNECRVPTSPARGAVAIFEDVRKIAESLAKDASAIGVGLAELVGLSGDILSEAAIPWRRAGIRERLAEILPTTIQADVRAAALAEARFGAGARSDCFLYVTIGTGISSCLMIDGKPFCGARGLTGTFASARGLIPADSGGLAAGPPLEEFGAGPALARNQDASLAGRAVGAAIAQLVNILDPEFVVLGGGLGCAQGVYHESLERSFREHLWAELHRDVQLRKAALGPSAGIIGAALATQS